MLYTWEYTKAVVVLKKDINTVDVVHSTKIHLPPHCLVGTVWTYWLCPHTRRDVFVHSVTCYISIGVIARRNGIR